MHTALRMAEERPFQMNAYWSGTAGARSGFLRDVDSIGQPFDGSKRVVQRSGYGRRYVRGNAMAGKQALDIGQRVRVGVHDVVAGCAVDVQVDVARDKDGIAEINKFCASGERPFAARREFANHTVFDQ